MNISFVYAFFRGCHPIPTFSVSHDETVMTVPATAGAREEALAQGLQQLLWLVVFRHPSEKYEFVHWDD